MENTIALTPEQHKAASHAITKFLQGAQTLQEIFAVSPNLMAYLYAEGDRFFRAGKYQDAEAHFQLLIRLNPNDMRYAYAIGLCYECRHIFPTATSWYLLASSIDTENPLPFYRMGECAMSSKHPEDALLFWERALKRAHRNTPKYQVLIERLNQMLQKKENSHDIER